MTNSYDYLFIIIFAKWLNQKLQFFAFKSAEFSRVALGTYVVDMFPSP